MADLVPRLAQGLLDELASALRIVIVNGPRQSGKTTMLRQYQRAHGGSYRTLDNRQDQEAAAADPVAFAAEGEPPRLIDEVHLGGDWLVRAIKIAVDEDPRPGRYILSGSSRFLTVPTLSESLAGRAAFIDLWPLSMAEVTGGSADFLSRVFREPDSLRGAESTWTRDEYIRAICSGDGCHCGSPAAGLAAPPVRSDETRDTAHGMTAADVTVLSEEPGLLSEGPRWPAMKASSRTSSRMASRRSTTK